MRHYLKALFLGSWLVLTCLSGCRSAPDLAATQAAALRQLTAELSLTPLTAVSHPNQAQVALGQALFFETELSGNRDVSCATCHHPQFGWSDGLPLSIGTGGTGLGRERGLGDGRQFAPRHSLDIANRGQPEWETMFWDGRVSGSAVVGFTTPAGELLPPGLESALAAQAMFTVISRHEMRGGLYEIAGYIIQPGEFPDQHQNRPPGWADRDIFGQENELAALGNAPEDMPLIWAGLMARLQASPTYPSLFAAAYPGTPLAAMDFTYAANALAAFQTAHLNLTDTAWDRYLAGDDGALSLAAQRGALLFYGRANCSQCHSGPLFSDQQFHNIAVPQFGPGVSAIAPLDYGRYKVTDQPEDRFAFRTPPLRNAAVSAPYLHNGAYDNLADVIRHHLEPARYLAAYDGRQLPAVLRPTLQNEAVTQRQILATLSPLLTPDQPLSDREIGYLVAFLESLTDSSLTAGSR